MKLNLFSFIKNGIDKTMANEYSYQLLNRFNGMVKDLETFSKVVCEIDINEIDNNDIKRHHRQLIERIQVI
jgi:hypothetical protein